MLNELVQTGRPIPESQCSMPWEISQAPTYLVNGGTETNVLKKKKKDVEKQLKLPFPW